METGLGSPRSSSGYGSSEEDHHGSSGAVRRRRTSYAQSGTFSAATGVDGIVLGSSGSAPQTPQSLSPSETGSSLSSPNPFSIDFRSVFDDTELGSMPDFADLAAFSAADGLDDVELPVDLWSGDIEAWTKEFNAAVYDSQPPTIQVDDVRQTGSKGADKRPLRDDSHILVSLLKRPKAELDWIATGQTPPPAAAAVDQFLAGDSDEAIGTGRSLNVKQVANASPLQRLKALTNSDVVNEAVNQLAATCTPAVIRTGVSLSSAVPVRVVQQATSELSQDGRTLIVRRQNSSPAPCLSFTSSPPVASAIIKRRSSGSKFSQPDYRSSPAASTAARTLAAPVTVRRVRSELDDHRYSTPMPPTVAVRPWNSRPPSVSAAAAKPSRSARTSLDSRCQRRSSTTVSPRSSSASVLEMLLRTSKRLRPNDGSDALLSKQRGSVPSKRPPASRRRTASDVANLSQTRRPQATMSRTQLAAFSLTGLDTAAVSKCDVVEHVEAVTSAGTPSGSSSSELTSANTDCFSLFSEHLLCDSQGVIDVGLLTDDQLAWTPSRLDDKVISSELEEIMQEQVRQDDTWLQQYLSELL